MSPSLSFLDQFYSEHQKGEVHYLADMQNEQESQHDGQQNRGA